MIYGLYLSATGIMTSTYKQDVIANNLANSETTAFKRDVPEFRQRLNALAERQSPGDWSDSALDGLGGGLFIQPTRVNLEQGSLEPTGSPLDIAIQGDGFFGVDDQGKTRLTRDGRFRVDREGYLTLSGGQRVLDTQLHPISLSPNSPVVIHDDGQVIQDGQSVAQVGMFRVPNRNALTKVGNDLLAYPDPGRIEPTSGMMHSEYIERSNVEPTTELTELMDTQRQLEANANMIRTQDSTLQVLVNQVGKIS